MEAGKVLLLGDVDLEETLAPYRKVARTLKPVCVKKHFPPGPRGAGFVRLGGTASRLARFDWPRIEDSDAIGPRQRHAR